MRTEVFRSRFVPPQRSGHRAIEAVNEIESNFSLPFAFVLCGCPTRERRGISISISGKGSSSPWHLWQFETRWLPRVLSHTDQGSDRENHSPEGTLVNPVWSPDAVQRRANTSEPPFLDRPRDGALGHVLPQGVNAVIPIPDTEFFREKCQTRQFPSPLCIVKGKSHTRLGRSCFRSDPISVPACASPCGCG